MAITVTTDADFVVQILNDTMEGVFTQRNAFMGSVIASAGGVMVQSNMPKLPIGREITIPYFGTLGEFTSRAETVDAVPNKIAQLSETKTVACASLAFEVSTWAQAVGNTPDPYAESARQLQVAATRYMDQQIINTADATPLVEDEYSSGVPQYLTPQLLASARARAWGDQNTDVVGMVCHSAAVSDLRQLTDNQGRPLMLDNWKDNDNVPMFMGLPIVESDRAPITGSTQPTATVATGATSPPTLTLAGTPLGIFRLRIRNVAGTTLGANTTIQFSTDGGSTWSGTIAVPDTNPVALTDPNADPLVGVDGATGLTAAFSTAFGGTDNVWGSNTLAKVSTLVIKRNSMAFWYAGSYMGLQTDKYILRDTDVAASHMYNASCLYRRTPTSRRPPVLKIIHNVTQPTVSAADLANLAL